MARCKSEAVEVRLRGRLAWGRRRATVWCSRGMVRQPCKPKKWGEWTCKLFYASGQCGHARERKEIPVGFVGFLHFMGHARANDFFGLNVFWAKRCG